MVYEIVTLWAKSLYIDLNMSKFRWRKNRILPN